MLAIVPPICRSTCATEGGLMGHEIQTVIGAIIGGAILVLLVLHESPGVLAVARLLLPVGCGPIFFPACWF